MRIIYIGLFGLIGIFSRFYLGVWASRIWPSSFPHTTFLINMIGSFLIGTVYVIGAERGGISPDLRVGLMVGLLGGFTTYSSYALETVRLLEESEIMIAATYWLLSSVIGFGSAFLGMWLARALVDHQP